MKTCSACAIAKSLSEFNKNRAQKDGLDNQCTICSRKSKSKWKKLNRASCNAQMRSVYAKDPDKQRTRMRLFRLSHPGLNARQSMQRHAAMLRRTPHWLTDLQWQHIEMFYESAFLLTKEQGRPLHVDHIIPLRGKNVSGLHVPWNLQIITADENRRKGNRY